MTPDERRNNLRAELAALGVPADHISHRLLDRNDPLTGSVDLLCMEAVDTMFAFRDHATACRSLLDKAERENERLKSAMAATLAEIEQIRGALQIIRDAMPREVAHG